MVLEEPLLYGKKRELVDVLILVGSSMLGLKSRWWEETGNRFRILVWSFLIRLWP